MILSKPLFIIVWMYQEMMRWLSRVLNGVVVGLGRIFDKKFMGKTMTFLILMKPNSCKFNPA
jgi:hypothetical protein